MKHPFRSLLTICLGGIACATVFAYLAQVHPVLALFSHFRVQLAAAASLFLALALLSRRPRASLLAGLLLAANLVPVWPYLTMPLSPAAAAAPGIRLMTLNLQHRHARIDEVERLIEQQQPTAVLLTELPPKAELWLARLRARYAHQVHEPGSSVFDVVLLSKWPIETAEMHRDAGASFPVLEARLCEEAVTRLATRCFTVVGLHAANPLHPRSPQRRDVQLALAGAAAKRAPGGRAAVLGDLNTTPWGPEFGALLIAGGLRDASLGHGLRATWLSTNPLLGLPIDHILVGDGLAVQGYRLGPDFGSDHFPVIADLAFIDDPRRQAAAKRDLSRSKAGPEER